MAANSKDVSLALEEQIASYVTGEDADSFSGYGLPEINSNNVSINSRSGLPTGAGTQSGLDAAYEEIKANRSEPVVRQEISKPGGLMNALNRGWERLTVLPDVVQGDVDEIAQYAKDIKKYARSESELARLEEIGKSTSFGAALLGWLSNPDLTLQVVAESLPMSLPSLGLGAIGMATAGPVGAGAGAFAGSFTVEYLNTILDEVESAGNDPTNPQTLLEAFSNEDFMDAASERGVERGIPIAVFDALSFGFAGKLVGAAKNAGKLTKTAIGAEVLGLQPGAGALGETFAQISEGKEKLDFSDIAAEYIGDLVPGIAEVAIGRVARSSAVVDPDAGGSGGKGEEDDGPALPTGVPVDTPVAPDNAAAIDPAQEQAMEDQLDDLGGQQELPLVPTPNVAPAPAQVPAQEPQQLGLPLEGGTPIAPPAQAPVSAPQLVQVAPPATPGAVPAPQAPGVATPVAPEAVVTTPVVEPTPLIDVDTTSLVEPLTAMVTPEDPAIRTAARDVLRALSGQEETGTVEERQRLGRRGAVFTKEGVTDFAKAITLLSEYAPQLEALAPGLVDAINSMDAGLVGQKLNEATQKLTGEAPTTTPASQPAGQGTVFDAMRFALEQVTAAEAKGTKISDQLAAVLDLATTIVGRKKDDGSGRTQSVISELVAAGKQTEANALAKAAAKAMPRRGRKKDGPRFTLAELASQLRAANNKQGGKGYNINKKDLMEIKAGLRKAAEVALKHEPTPKPKVKTKASAASPSIGVVTTTETKGKPEKTESKTATKAEKAKESSKKRTAEKKAEKKESKSTAKTTQPTGIEPSEAVEAVPKFTKLTSAAMDVVRQVNEHGTHRSLMKMYTGDQLQQMAGKLGLLREGKKGDLAIRIFNFVKLGTSKGKVTAPKALAAAENEVRAERKAKQEERAKKKATKPKPPTKPKPEPKGAAKAKAVSKQAGGRKAVVGTRAPKAVTPTGNPLKALAAEFFGYELKNKDQLKWSEFKEVIGDNAADAVRWLTGFTQAFKDVGKSTADVTIMQKGWSKLWNAFQDVVNSTPDGYQDATVTLQEALAAESTVDNDAVVGLVDAAFLLHQARQTRLAEQAADIAEPADIIAELESQAGNDPLAQTELAILMEQQEQSRVADEMGELAPEDFITEQEAADIAEQTSAVVDEEETYSELGDEFALDDSVNEEGEYTGKGELQFDQIGKLTGNFSLGLDATRKLENYLRDLRGNFRKTMRLHALMQTMLGILPDSHPYAEVAKNILATVNDTKVVIMDNANTFSVTGTEYGGFYRGTKTSLHSGETYAPASDLIHVSNGHSASVFAHTVMHEAVHAVTVGKYSTDFKFRDQMDELFEDVITAFGGRSELLSAFQYGVKNPKEMIAEAFTNPQFQRALSQIQVPTNKYGKPGRNIFAVFKELVAKALGLHTLESSALDVIFDIVEFEHVLTTKARAGSLVIRGVPTGEKPLQWVSAATGLPVDQINSSKPIGRKAQERQFNKQLKTAQKKASGRWRQNRNKFLNLQTIDQIIRRHASKFDVLTNASEQINPIKQWYKANLDRIKTARHIHHAARDHIRRYNKLPENVKDKFQQLMLDTTLWTIHPDKGINDVAHDHLKDKKLKIKPDVLRQHTKLQAAWKAMGSTEKKLYLDMVAAGAELRTDTIAALMERLARRHGVDENPAAFAKLKKIRTVEELAALIGEEVLDVPGLLDLEESAKTVLSSLNVQGPYLPVRRYGKYLSSAKRDESLKFANEADAQRAADAWTIAERANTAKVAGDIVTFKGSVYSEHQTLNEAEEARLEYIRLGYSADTANAKTKDVSTLATAAGLTKLMSQLEKTVKTKVLRGQLDNAIAELLAENVNQASKLRRANIPGANAENMMRGYAERMYGAGWNLGDIQTSYSMDNAMRNMGGLTRAGNDIEAISASKDTLLRRQDLYNHILKVENNTLRDRSSSGINRVLGGTGFLWYLASPSYSFINASQVPLITLPYLSSKYGYGRTTLELTKLYKEMLPQLITGLWTSKVGIAGTEEAVYDNMKKVLDKQGYGDAFQALTDLNVIDATFIQELVDTVNGMTTSGKTIKGVDSVLQVARTLPLSIETLNRVVTGMAAYKLAKGNEAQKIEAAAEAIRETQFDYSIFNRPHWFKALPASRALMMFKMYPQGIYSLLTTGIQGLAKKGKRAEAAKLLTGIIGTHTLAAGVLGGVMLEPLRLLLSALPDDWTDWDDDEEFDAWARRIATDEMGMSAAQAQVFLKGIPNMAGVDVYSRLGLHNLVTMQAPDLSDRTSQMETMISLGGPIAQIPLRVMGALTEISESGDLWKAAQLSFPVAWGRQLAKAYRLSDQGMTDSRGNLLVNKNKFDWRKIALTSIGFQPSLVSETYEARNAVLGKQHAVDDRRNRVLQQIRTASTPTERRKAQEAKRKFNMSVAFERRIMVRDEFSSKRSKRERERNTRKGVYTKYRDQRKEVDRYNLP